MMFESTEFVVISYDEGTTDFIGNICEIYESLYDVFYLFLYLFVFEITVLLSVYYTLDTIHQVLCIKVNKQPHSFVHQLQICQKLLMVKRFKLLCGL